MNKETYELFMMEHCNKSMYIVEFTFETNHDYEERQVCYFETKEAGQAFVDMMNKDLNEWLQNSKNTHYDFLYLPPFSDYDFLNKIPSDFMNDPQYILFDVPSYFSLIDGMELDKRIQKLRVLTQETQEMGLYDKPSEKK